MAEFPILPGYYRILSLVDDSHPPTGIPEVGSGPAFVRLNQPVQVWKITPGPDGSFNFSIGEFPYTGIEGFPKEVVTATLDADKNVPWYITRAESQKGYIITVDREGSRGWTVDGADGIPKPPDNLIVIQPIIILTSDPPQYLTTQLFRFEPILE